MCPNVLSLQKESILTNILVLLLPFFLLGEFPDF